MFLLHSCNFPYQSDINQQSQEVSQKYSTVSAFLTETARVETAPGNSTPPEFIPTLTLKYISITETPSPVGDPELGLQKTTRSTTQETEKFCNLAQAGRPIDITIPDETRLHPGEFFSKTWRLVNAGECVWDSNYAVVWFSGDQLGLGSGQAFSSPVNPGDSVDVTLEMIAPLAPGTYQSNWKLRNDQGELFGIGPHGDAPFWVRIIVIPADTSTPTLTLPVATATPEIFASGTFSLSLNQRADLDSGLIDRPKGNDIGWRILAGDKPMIAPEDGAQLALFGLNVPELQDCVKAPMFNQPIGLDQLQPGTYLCYRTTAGLSGRVSISYMDLEKNILDLDFITWVVP